MLSHKIPHILLFSQIISFVHFIKAGMSSCSFKTRQTATADIIVIFCGLSALLTMLNSCASGISVVNIDNGFGAGYLAATINKLD